MVTDRKISSMNRLYVAVLLLAVLQSMSFAVHASHFSFKEEFIAHGDPSHVQFGSASHNQHPIVQLLLDETATPGFESREQYSFGIFSVQIKPIHNDDSSGTATSFYLESEHNESIVFAFLGNVSGQPYLLHTDLITNGDLQGREQQFSLWFTPTDGFHTLTIWWNHYQTVWLVDNVPVRRFSKQLSRHNKYPMGAMKVHGSIYDASKWATRGGLDTIDFSNGPFLAWYRDFNINACVETASQGVCDSWKTNPWEQTYYQRLNFTLQMQLQQVTRHYLVYDYCTDKSRYPIAPTECASNRIPEPHIYVPTSLKT